MKHLFALQDFLKEVDIRFMDQLRRGASIVATDLARAPQPASLRDCYQLMCITTPEADQIEASIATLKEEIDMRKAAVADKEALLANHNPPVFQAVQVSVVAMSSVSGEFPCLCFSVFNISRHSLLVLSTCSIWRLALLVLRLSFLLNSCAVLLDRIALSCSASCVGV